MNRREFFSSIIAAPLSVIGSIAQSNQDEILSAVEIVAYNYGERWQRWHLAENGDVVDLTPYAGKVPKPEDRIPRLEKQWKTRLT